MFSRCRGRDRCRHFVINQSKSGQFLVHGDNRVHDTVSDLIEHYKTSPIQPFGEHLTTSCFEVRQKFFSHFLASNTLVKKEVPTGVLLRQALNEELYDIIQVGSDETPFGAVRNMPKPQNSVLEQPPSRPPRSNRTLNVSDGINAGRLCTLKCYIKGPILLPLNHHFCFLTIIFVSSLSVKLPRNEETPFFTSFARYIF